MSDRDDADPQTEATPQAEAGPPPEESALEQPGAVRTVSAPAPSMPGTIGEDGFDPWAKLFREDGMLDADYSSRRVSTLVDVLRNDPRCFDVRIEHDVLGQRLLADDAVGLTDADDEEAFEAAVTRFSGEHLHELCSAELAQLATEALTEVARDVDMSRRQRVSAALGIALMSGLPDGAKLRGRAFFDLVFRVSLEELHAEQQLRMEARREVGGLPAEELEQFWRNYPALRHRYEKRYRRELEHVIRQIEEDVFPQAISVDLALRGASALLAEVARANEAGQTVDMDRAQGILREPFQQDLLDGREIVIERWHLAAGAVTGASADDRRAFIRTVETAIRLVTDGGPAADVLIFYSYLRALVNGRFYVVDQAEAKAARGIFSGGGLSVEAVISYAAFHDAQGSQATRRRLLLAAVEIWPEDETVRAAAEQLGEQEMRDAQTARQGPRYGEDDDSDDPAPDLAGAGGGTETGTAAEDVSPDAGA